MPKNQFKLKANYFTHRFEHFPQRGGDTDICQKFNFHTRKSPYKPKINVYKSKPESFFHENDTHI